MDGHQYNTQPNDTNIVTVLGDKYVGQTLIKTYHVKVAIYETIYESSDLILVACMIAVVVAKLTSDEFAMRDSS